MTEQKTKTLKKTDAQLIKDFFFKGVTTKDLMPEWKALSKEDKADLAKGLRDESYTY